MRRYMPLWAILGLALWATPGPAQEGVQCDRCHGNPEVLAGPGVGDPELSPLHVPDTLLAGSAHRLLSCTTCHTSGYDHGYPHTPTAEEAASMGLISLQSAVGEIWVRSCGSCHHGIEEEIRESSHAPENDSDVASVCTICHSAHGVYPRGDRRSAMHPLNQVRTCAGCHSGATAVGGQNGHGQVRDYVAEYERTVHARGVDQSGLVTSATCSDCHGAHRVLPSGDSRSRVSRDSIPGTCGRCHEGVLIVYEGAKHGESLGAGALQPRGGHQARLAPTCADCHSSHDIQRVDEPRWHVDIATECGTCHQDLYETYHLTYHGKVTELGGGLTAKCTDCHTAHDVRPADDPLSSVSAANVVATCRACHPRANARFAEYQSHGDHRDRERYPILYWTYTLMTGLLVSVFFAWAAHTGLWFLRIAVGRGLIRKDTAASRRKP